AKSSKESSHKKVQQRSKIICNSCAFFVADLLNQQCRKRRSGCAAWKQARSGSLEYIPDVLGIGIDQIPHEAVLHLLPILQAPKYQLRRIGIPLVVGRIVEMRDADDACSFRNLYRLYKINTDLPVEIPLGLEDRFHFSIGVNQTNFIVLAAQVHVG